ncbi:hypothetical protein ACLOJK_020033 [Asimina triloba]
MAEPAYTVVSDSKASGEEKQSPPFQSLLLELTLELPNEAPSGGVSEAAGHDEHEILSGTAVFNMKQVLAIVLVEPRAMAEVRLKQAVRNVVYSIAADCYKIVGILDKDVNMLKKSEAVVPLKQQRVACDLLLSRYSAWDAIGYIPDSDSKPSQNLKERRTLHKGIVDTENETESSLYNDILNSGTDFMDLVGAHRQALSALDSKERGPDSEHTINLKSCPSQCESTDQDMHTEKRNDQNGKTDGIAERKGQLVQEEEREKGRFKFSFSFFRLGAITGWLGRLQCPKMQKHLLRALFSFWSMLLWPLGAPFPAEELIEEIAMLALEVAYLEQLLLSLYRRASDQQIASSSPSNIDDERSRSTLKSKARLFQEAKRLDIKPRRESPAVRSGRMFSPHAPINSSGEDLSDTRSIKKLQMPSIQRSQSSLTQCSVCSNRISSPKKNPGPSKRGHLSQPLSLLEEAVNANGKWGCSGAC